MANQTSTVYVRVNAEDKKKAEQIIYSLGITPSAAIQMFYKQIILHRGLPFEVKIPDSKLVDISILSDTEMDAELEKGYADMKAGRTKPVKSAFAEIRKDYDI